MVRSSRPVINRITASICADTTGDAAAGAVRLALAVAAAGNVFDVCRPSGRLETLE